MYGYRALNIWQRTTQIARTETHCCHYMGYFFRLAAKVLLYAPSHRQDSTYNSHVVKTGMSNNSTRSPLGIDPTTHRMMNRCSTMNLCFAPNWTRMQILNLKSSHLGLTCTFRASCYSTHLSWTNDRNQWSTTGLSKAVVCTVLSMEKCI